MYNIAQTLVDRKINILAFGIVGQVVISFPFLSDDLNSNPIDGQKWLTTCAINHLESQVCTTLATSLNMVRR